MHESIVATPDPLFKFSFAQGLTNVKFGGACCNNHIKPSKKGTIEIINKGLWFKLINSMSFGESVFSTGFTRKPPRGTNVGRI
jgi:hypothetical protein